LLDIAARCHELTAIGYIGVDLVLDRDRGPLILELNARPGLNIQIANRRGLLPRLRLIEQHHAKLKQIGDRISFAGEHFNCDFQDLLI
jgi:glutathione synthase/RimK-type ligase-like ATP-grasp enzyme